MTNAKFPKSRSSIFLVLGLGLAILPACGGSEPPAQAPPPPPPAPVAAAPAPPPPPPSTAPAPAAEVAAPAPPKHHGHGMEAMFLASLDALELKPEQKTTVEGIESDMEKLGDASKEPRAKLEADVADGVVAGKIDHKKTDADITALSNAVAATTPTMQDTMNRLYKTLDADQRKKLIESMREKGKEMHEHMGAEHMGEGKGPGGGKEHEHMGEGKGAGPGAGKEHEGMAKGPGGKEHEHEGMGHEHEGMGHEHDGMGEGPLMKLGDELALTDDQKAKLKPKLEAQMKANHAAMKMKMEETEKHMDAIGTAFEGDKFDAKKAGVGMKAPEMVKAMATQKVQFVETILAVLTPEQRLKFADHLKAHANDMEEGG